MSADFLWKRILFDGHRNCGPLTLYGYDTAMHFAVNLWVRWLGYVCWHPETRWKHLEDGDEPIEWPWYFYISPNATPWASTFALGPGVEKKDRETARIRRRKFGFVYDTDVLFDNADNPTPEAPADE